MDPMRGDVIKFSRAGYKHYAIYLGADGAGPERIIHWWTEDRAVEPCIQITPFQDLADILDHDVEERPKDGNQVAERAEAFMQCVNARLADGNRYQSLFDDNNHFARWCCLGLGRIDIDLEEIRNVRDPWRFVHGSVTNYSNPVIGCENDQLLTNLRPGEIIRFCHQDYEHWAFYIGEQEGVHNVIHWWDRDSVDVHRIVIDEFENVAGHCKAEIDSYLVDVDYARAVLLANQLQQNAGLFADNVFATSKRFAFWCCFGLGLSDLDRVPDMATEADVMNFVNGLMETSDPDRIRGLHNNMTERQLNQGDVITLSQNSRKYFAVCIDSEIEGQRHIIRWMDNGVPSIKVDLFQEAAQNKKAMVYTNRDLLGNVTNWNEMVNRAIALTGRVRNDAEEDYNGLFSSSKHFALWVFDNYGLNDSRVTVQEIERFPDIWEHIYGFHKSTKTRETKIRIREENKRVLENLKEGDLVSFYLIKFRMIHYKHYAVYIGECENTGALSLIHMYPDPNDYILNNPKAFITTDAFWKVAGYDVAENGNDYMNEHRALDRNEVLRRAIAQQCQSGNIRYHLLKYNCEHFARMCRYEDASSRQVDRWMWWWPWVDNNSAWNMLRKFKFWK